MSGAHTAAYVARFPGTCAVCEDRFDAGESITHSPFVGGWCHADCVHGDRDDAPKAMCTRCFQIPATNGTCGCETT